MDDIIIIRVLSGKAEPIEERSLASWRSESSQNEQHFREVSAIWDWTGTTAPANDVESPPPAPTLETIVSQGDALGRQDVRLRFARGLGRKEIRPWAAAAVIAAVSLGVWIGRLGPAPEEIIGTEYAALIAEAATVALVDGSFVRLAPGSRLRFAERAELREAWLSGRGFFAVESDAERPFLIHTDLGEARVLGTRFEMASGTTELRLIVVEGAGSRHRHERTRGRSVRWAGRPTRDQRRLQRGDGRKRVRSFGLAGGRPALPEHAPPPGRTGGIGPLRSEHRDGRCRPERPHRHGLVRGRKPRRGGRVHLSVGAGGV